MGRAAGCGVLTLILCAAPEPADVPGARWVPAGAVSDPDGYDEALSAASCELSGGHGDPIRVIESLSMWSSDC